MYADIGPFSVQKQPCVSTIHQEDDRVEYSQVNFKAKAPQVSMNATNNGDLQLASENSIGIILHCIYVLLVPLFVDWLS